MSAAALVRGDDGNLHIRQFATPAAAAAVAADGRELREFANVDEVTVVPHPAGGMTYAVRVPGTISARIYCGWAPASPRKGRRV